jgi:hypothetical protein
MENQTREEILAASLDARAQEVMLYQINIDNYTLALAEIENLPEQERDALKEFTNQLQTLLASEIQEQKKANIMLAVVRKQLQPVAAG